MLAIKKGLEAALLNNIECIIVETDALQIVKALNGEETPPWCISNYVKTVKELQKLFQAWKVLYMFREES